jgi:hypothetical protein
VPEAVHGTGSHRSRVAQDFWSATAIPDLIERAISFSVVPLKHIAGDGDLCVWCDSPFNCELCSSGKSQRPLQLRRLSWCGSNSSPDFLAVRRLTVSVGCRGDEPITIPSNYPFDARSDRICRRLSRIAGYRRKRGTHTRVFEVLNHVQRVPRDSCSIVFKSRVDLERDGSGARRGDGWCWWGLRLPGSLDFADWTPATPANCVCSSVAEAISSSLGESHRGDSFRVLNAIKTKVGKSSRACLPIGAGTSPLSNEVLSKIRR